MTKATSQEITFAHAQFLPSSRPHWSAWPTLSITLCVLLTACVSVARIGMHSWIQINLSK